MKNLKLITPTLQLKKEFLSMYLEWETYGEIMIPCTVGLYEGNFATYINNLNNYSKGEGFANDFVPHKSPPSILLFIQLQPEKLNS